MPRKMKESGVEWLGQIPEGWEVCRVKDSFAYQKGLNITKADLVDRGIFVISYGQIHSKTNTGTYIGDGLLRFVPESFLESNAECLLKKNDFVFADTSEDLDGLGNCAFCDRDDVIFAGYHTIVLRPTQTQEWKYCAYLFKTDAWRSQFRSLAFGIKVFSLSQRLLNVCTFVLPPLPEQQRIAAFLDERCAKIDGMIAEAKASIEDYNVYRQDVIDCLANFGSCSIDKVKVRDSGNIWLNKVPAAWDVLKIGLIFKENCRAPKDEDIPLSLSQKDGLIPTDLMQEHSLKTSTYENWKRVLPDDLVLNRFKAHLGVFYASQYTGMVSFHYGVFVARRPLSVKYYEYLFHSTPYRRMFAELSNGITVGLQNLSNSSFYSARCVCPPVEDQRRIVAFLDEKCAAIDKLVGEKEALIADLEAYKKSLIFETVTGKREVV